MKGSIIIVKYLSTSYVPGSELSAAGLRPRKMQQSLSKKKKKKNPSHGEEWEKEKGRQNSKHILTYRYNEAQDVSLLICIHVTFLDNCKHRQLNCVSEKEQETGEGRGRK